MRAIVIDEWGGREAMREADVDDAAGRPPTPSSCASRAAGVNPVDCEGPRAATWPRRLPPPPPAHHSAGTWPASSRRPSRRRGVPACRPGDEVYAYVRRHHLAVRHLRPSSRPRPRPTVAPQARLAQSFEEAAALPLVGLTAHQALETIGVRGGETLFIGGGAGGVGHVAVQLGLSRGARVIATASERNQDFLRELGAEPLDYADGDVPARVRELTGDGGADATLDLFGGDGREEAFAALRRGGRFVSLAQPPPEPRDGYEVHYVFVRPDGDELRELAELVQGGQLRPHVEEVYPLERAAEAHERVEGGHVRGKVVLSVP